MGHAHPARHHAIGDAEPSPVEGWLIFLIWVALAQGLHLLAWLSAIIAPGRAAPILAGAAVVLERYSRPLVIGINVVFGIWFLLKALAALG